MLQLLIIPLCWESVRVCRKLLWERVRLVERWVGGPIGLMNIWPEVAGKKGGVCETRRQ